MRAIWRVAHMASAETKGWPPASPVVAALLVITAFAVAAGDPMSRGSRGVGVAVVIDSAVGPGG